MFDSQFIFDVTQTIEYIGNFLFGHDHPFKSMHLRVFGNWYLFTGKY